MEITRLGSARLYAYCKVKLQQALEEGKYPVRVKDSDVAKILSFSNADVSNWKRGKRIIRNVEHYILLSATLKVPLTRLVMIAAEKEVPQEIQEQEAFIKAKISGKR